MQTFWPGIPAAHQQSMILGILALNFMAKKCNNMK
jgi:hypothetical protein